MMRSIQTRLLVLTLAALFIVGASTAWFAYRRSVHEVDELMDAQLVQYARILLALAHESDDDEVKPPDIEGHAYAERLIFQVWHTDDGRDRLLLRSPEAPTAWPTGAARRGYSDVHIGAQHWRVLAARDGDTSVLAGLDTHIRDELAGDMAMGQLQPYLAAIPLLGLLFYLVIRWGLAPLRRIEAALAQRTPEELAPLAETDGTRELAPVVRAMNDLFSRVRSALDHERRFTSDAAHELRTPLAALSMQLQVAQRTGDAEERAAAIAKALRGGDRMRHLIEQLLALARLETRNQGFTAAPVALSALALDLLGDFAAEAHRADIDLGADIAPDVEIAGDESLLRILLRNLLDNALRYVPRVGRVHLSVMRTDDRACLSVEDNGPGVPSEAFATLGRRFNRLGPQVAEGVGLGLSIVHRIATLHAGRVDYGPGLDGRGLSVRICLAVGGAD